MAARQLNSSRRANSSPTSPDAVHATPEGSVALFDRRPCRGGTWACADQMAGLISSNHLATANPQPVPARARAFVGPAGVEEPGLVAAQPSGWSDRRGCDTGRRRAPSTCGRRHSSGAACPSPHGRKRPRRAASPGWAPYGSRRRGWGEGGHEQSVRQRAWCLQESVKSSDCELRRPPPRGGGGSSCRPVAPAPCAAPGLGLPVRVAPRLTRTQYGLMLLWMSSRCAESLSRCWWGQQRPVDLTQDVAL
jgi:hypothetical protein